MDMARDGHNVESKWVFLALFYIVPSGALVGFMHSRVRPTKGCHEMIQKLNRAFYVRGVLCVGLIWLARMAR
jgi:hypothetical protein